MALDQSQRLVYIAGMEGFSILGALGFLMFCIIIVLVRPAAPGRNMKVHGPACQCPVFAKPDS